MRFPPRQIHIGLLIAAAAVFLWSAIRPRDLLTWFMEIAPAAILMVGGHYTYAQEPVFNWLKDAFHLDRNYYDRLGHFGQGFVPAAIAREVLIRWTGIRRGRMLIFLVLCVAMAISAWYEILEFVVARILGSSAENFLGTQGDVWDTQWDMTSCFIGAIASLAVIPSWQDRAIARLNLATTAPAPAP